MTDQQIVSPSMAAKKETGDKSRSRCALLS